MFKTNYTSEESPLEAFLWGENNDKIARFTVYLIIPFTSLLAHKLMYSLIFLEVTPEIAPCILD